MIPAITIWQPWASLIAVGAKRFETRSWPPAPGLIGKRLAIHASARPCMMVGDPEGAAMECALKLPRSMWGQLPRGAVVATGTLAGAYQVARHDPAFELVNVGREVQGSADSYKRLLVETREAMFGDFGFARWLWCFEDVEELQRPVPATGRQKVWMVADSWHRGVRAHG